MIVFRFAGGRMKFLLGSHPTLFWGEMSMHFQDFSPPVLSLLLPLRFKDRVCGGGEMEEQRSERRDVLLEGAIILGGQYRVLQLLHQRPRVNLYLGKRLEGWENATVQNDAHEVFVAIRELMLTGLAPQTCVEIEQAAFEEFVSPLVLSSPRLPGAIDFVRIEGGRHYLVMQLNGCQSEHSAFSTQHVT